MGKNKKKKDKEEGSGEGLEGGGSEKGLQGRPREDGELPGTSGGSAAPQTQEVSSEGRGSGNTGLPTQIGVGFKNRSRAEKKRAKRRRLAAGSAELAGLAVSSPSAAGIVATPTSSEGSGGGTPAAAGGKRKRGGEEALRRAADTSRQPPSGSAKAGAAGGKGAAWAGTGRGDSIKGVSSQSYAQAAKMEGPRIVVGLRGQETNLSSEDLLRFIETLNGRVSWYITRGGGVETPPRVRTIRLWRRHILIVADNGETREWIRRELVNIRPWGLANLVEVDPERLRLLRAAVWIPGLGADVSTEMLVRCLGAQNGLDSCLWRVWQRTEEGRGTRVVMGVDERSARAIAARGSQLFCLALQVRVSLAAPGPAAAEKEEATGSDTEGGSGSGGLEAPVGATGSPGEGLLDGGPVAEGAGPEGRQSGESMEVDAVASQEAAGLTVEEPAVGAPEDTGPGEEDRLLQSDSD